MTKMTAPEIVAAVQAGTHRVTSHAGKKRFTTKWRLEKWHAARGCWIESVQHPSTLRAAAKQMTYSYDIATSVIIYTA